MKLEQQYFNTVEVAKMLGVSRQTIIARIKEGVFPAKQYKKKGRYYIYYLDIPTFARQGKDPLDK